MNSDKIFSLQRFSKADWLTLAYIFLWIVLILLFSSFINQFKIFLLLHILSFLLCLFLSGITPKTGFLKFLTKWYHYFLLPLLYAALHYLIPAIHPHSMDEVLIKIDFFLFGCHPTVWLEQFYSPLLTEILQLSYLVYYFMPLLILIPFYCRGDIEKFDRFSFIILLTFYCFFLGYVLFPALGPRFYLAHLHTVSLEGKNIYHAICSLLNGLENIQWDAFPSGHVLVTIVFLYITKRYLPLVFYLTLPIAILSIISTVYLRYHYVIDDLVGIILAGFVLLIAKKVN